MIWTLRTKLSVSHTLPILIIMPILSLYLVYSLEGFFNESLLQQLTYQAQILREQSELDPQVTRDPQAAQSYLRQIAPLTDARVVLLSQDATILASTHPEDAPRIGQRYLDTAVAQALRGESVQGVGTGFTANVAYVVLPLQTQTTPSGALRVSYEVSDLRTQITKLQLLILGGIGVAIIIGQFVGLGLANTITRPLWQLDDRAKEIAAGDYHARVQVSRRDEVGTLAQSFNQMATRLEEAEQTRERQLASIVHELARPLTIMRAAVETLRATLDTNRELRDTMLDNLEEEFGRMERLLGNLRGIHRRVLRPMELNRSTIPLHRVINASVGSFEALTEQAGVKIQVDMPEDLPLLPVDEDRLIQVLTNLLDNALKFTPRGGTITVKANLKEDAVWVRVADTGTGIAPNELPHLFEPFYTGDESRPLERRGMGLGLTICREIITAHGGQVKVESDKTKGTGVSFSLPLH
ncbi:two-component system, OmpR family, sensor histidine kinase BaeS [Anaerolineae bacterium]|nr:two-component system, OmpR family, sensor histidine kinase BaeS [Anaerolineae bacterium]